MALAAKRHLLRRQQQLDFLSGLEALDDDGAISIYLPPGLPSPEYQNLLGEQRVTSTDGELAQAAARAPNGAALFWGSARKCLVLPPFPIREKAIFNGYVSEPLRLLLNSDFKIGLVLVHLGNYAIGVCQGENLISSKVGTGLIHGRHKKGGSSQQRFQRRRQNQVREFLERVCLHARKQLEPQARSLDYLIYGGPRQTVLSLQKRCPFLKALEVRALPTMDVPALRQRVLENAVVRLWSSVTIEWQEEPVIDSHRTRGV